MITLPRLGKPLTIDINIGNIVSYKTSLYKLTKSTELKDVYLTYAHNNYTLCSWTQKFEEIFKLGVKVRLKNFDGVTVCEVILKGLQKKRRDGLLYVDRIEKHGETIWSLSAQEENYKTIQDQNDYHDASSFFKTLMHTTDLEGFFKVDEKNPNGNKRKNVELIWVYTAEALRHPDRFYSNPGTIPYKKHKGLNSLYTLDHYHKHYFTRWDEHSEKAWLKYVSDKFVELAKPSSKGEKLPLPPPKKPQLSLVERYFQREDREKSSWVEKHADLGGAIYETKFASGKNRDACQMAEKIHEILKKIYNTPLIN